MTYWLPCTLTSVLLAVLAAMPWARPHPNHLFMLELLNAVIGDHPGLSRMNARQSGPAVEVLRTAA